MATYKLTGKRYLKKYTASGVTPVYAANVDAILCSELFDDVKWEAVSEPTAGMTLHTNAVVDESTGVTGLDRNVEIRNTFDAALFCAEHVAGMHRAHANAACYVFELPSMAAYPQLLSLKAKVTSDPYNSSGVRLAVHVADSVDIALAMAELREGVARVAGAVPREERVESDGKTYWYPRTSEVSVAVSGVALKRYLMLFVGLENYALSRGDWLEGSAYIAPTIEIETSGELAGASEGGVVGGGGEFVVCQEDFTPVISETLIIEPGEDGTEAAIPEREKLAVLLASDYYHAYEEDPVTSRHVADDPHEKTVAAYRAFFEDRMARSPILPSQWGNDWSGAGSFGASFSAGAEHYSFGDGDVSYREGCIWRKKVLVPFTVPAGLSPRVMTLSWSSSDAYAAVTGTPILRNVWIARGKLRLEYGAKDLQRHELYDCCASKVGDWELVASLRRGVGDTCEGLDVQLPFDVVAGVPHTLLLTCYIDIGEFKDFTADKTEAALATRALGAGLGRDRMLHESAVPGGWMPKIVLKG